MSIETARHDAKRHGWRIRGANGRASAELPGLHLIDPLRQGDCDGLCGVYAATNIARLVLAPHVILTEHQERALFRSAIVFVTREGDLSRAVRESVGRSLWPRLVERIAVRAGQLTGEKLLVQRPFSSQATVSSARLIQMVREAIKKGHAAALFMRGEYRHYSVISGYTPRSLRLFDSYGYQWLRRQSCGDADDPKARHRLYAGSMMTVGLA